MYPDDWLGDTNLQSNDFATIGFWANMTMRLFRSNTHGEITGTYEEIARLMGCNIQTTKMYIKNLCNTKTADVTISNNIVTISSRRMLRERNKRISGTQRVSEHRERKKKSFVTLSNKEKIEDRYKKIDNIPKNDLIEANKLAIYFEKHRLLENGIDTRELQKWVIEIYKLVKIDKESWNEIDRVIRWVLADDFWKTVVHSPLKFRRKDKEGIRYWDKFKQLSKSSRKGRLAIESEEDYNKPNMPEM